MVMIFFCPDFTVHSRGIYIRSDLHAQKHEQLSYAQFHEYLFCSVSLPSLQHVLVRVVYQSPNSSETNDLELWRFINAAAETALDSSHLITGDFNWSSWSAPGKDSPAGSLLEALDDGFLFQYVISPTRL